MSCPQPSHCVASEFCCRGVYTFSQDAFERGSTTLESNLTAVGLNPLDAFIPQLVITVEHRPALSLTVADSQCKINFTSEYCCWL